MQVDPAVKLLFACGHLVGGQPPGVVERLAPRQPGDSGVAAAVDRAVHRLAGFHVQHPQQGLLAAPLGQLVGQPPALLVRLPAVEGGPPARVDGHRVDERPPGAGMGGVPGTVMGGVPGTGMGGVPGTGWRGPRDRDGGVPGTGMGGVPGTRIHGAEHRVLFTGQPPGEEPPGAPPHRDPDVPGPRQFQDPLGQGRHPRQGRRMRPEQFVLDAQPGTRLGTAGVLEPPVGVADPVAQQILGQVEPPRGRVLVCGHDTHPSCPPRCPGAAAHQAVTPGAVVAIDEKPEGTRDTGALLRVYSYVVAAGRFSGHTGNTVSSDAKPPGGGGSATSPAAQRHV